MKKFTPVKKITDLEKESLGDTLQNFLNYLEGLFEGSVHFPADPIRKAYTKQENFSRTIATLHKASLRKRQAYR